jgi:hypothetical protein
MTEAQSDQAPGAFEEGHDSGSIPTEYLNTDLDLISAASLEPLANYLEGEADLLSCDLGPDEQWYLVAEAKDSGGADGDPATDIAGLLDVLEAAPAELRALLAGCSKRELNVGLGCGDTWAHVMTVPAPLVARAGALDLALAFTTYPIGDEFESEAVEVDEDGKVIELDEA